MKDNKFTTWVKSHKTEIAIAGGIILTTVGAVLLVNNWESVKGLVSKEIKELPAPALNVEIEKPSIPQINKEPVLKIVDVRDHLRNLPSGHHPSLSKLAEAAEIGIELGDNQTYVSAHPRCYAA